MSAQRDLDAIRQNIDALDQEIHALITQRAQLVCEVGDLKRAQGAGASNFYRPEREALILAQARARNQGPLSDQQVTSIFREIMSACLALETPLTVSFIGPEGSYTHAALTAHFGTSVSPLSTAEPRDVCRAVLDGRAHYGVLPVYNRRTGDVRGALSAVLETYLDTSSQAETTSRLKVIGEVQLDIRHQLFANSTISTPAISTAMSKPLQRIERVYAHPQSFAQCAETLKRRVPQAQWIVCDSNSTAALLAARDTAGAAIAGQEAGRRAQLTRVEQNLSDSSCNVTHFWVLTRAQRCGEVNVRLKPKVSPEVSHEVSPEVAPKRALEQIWITLVTIRGVALTALLSLCERHGVEALRASVQPDPQSDVSGGVGLYLIELMGRAKHPALNAVFEEMHALSSEYRLCVLGTFMRSEVRVSRG